jgi:hypothetical protein
VCVCVCVGSLSYPAYKAHARVTFSSVATQCHKRHDFRIKVIEHKMCFDFPYNFCLKQFHSKKNSARYHKCTSVFMWSTRYSCYILMKLEFSRQICEECSCMKFHKYPSSGSRVVPCGRTDVRTDGRDEAESSFFCKFANVCRIKVQENGSCYNFWLLFGTF